MRAKAIGYINIAQTNFQTFSGSMKQQTENIFIDETQVFEECSLSGT